MAFFQLTVSKQADGLFYELKAFSQKDQISP